MSSEPGLKLEQNLYADRFRYTGTEWFEETKERRPPFIFVSASWHGEAVLAFYVDSNLCGPYWPDEEGRMVLRSEECGMISFEKVPRRSAFRMLKSMAERIIERRGGKSPSDP